MSEQSGDVLLLYNTEIGYKLFADHVFDDLSAFRCDSGKQVVKRLGVLDISVIGIGERHKSVNGLTKLCHNCLVALVCRSVYNSSCSVGDRNGVDGKNIRYKIGLEDEYDKIVGTVSADKLRCRDIVEDTADVLHKYAKILIITVHCVCKLGKRSDGLYESINLLLDIGDTAVSRLKSINCDKHGVLNDRSVILDLEKYVFSRGGGIYHSCI